MATYTCRIEAEKALYPVLLSNGNLVAQGDLEARVLIVLFINVLFENLKLTCFE